MGEQQDRTTVPEGLWERGLCCVPCTGPRGPRSHQDIYSAGLGKNGVCYPVLKVPCGPQGQEEWGRGWMAKWLISGAASGSFSGYQPFSLSLSLFSVALSFFFYVSVPFFFSVSPCFPASPKTTVSISLCLFLSLFVSVSQSAHLVSPPAHSCPFPPCRPSDVATETPTSHHIRFKCLPMNTSESLGAPLRISTQRMLGVQPCLAPKSLDQSAQVAGWNRAQGLAFRRQCISQRRGLVWTHPKMHFLQCLGRLWLEVGVSPQWVVSTESDLDIWPALI